MAIWGVLRLPPGTDAAAGAGDGPLAAGLAVHLDGVLAVTSETSMRGVLAALPDRVTRIVELDAATATDPEAGRLLGALLALADGTHAAVVAARPLADALKRVEGDVVVAGLLRDGLLTPELPRVIERAPLEAVASDAGPQDAVALLLAAGHAVRILPAGSEPLTVRADGVAR
jgi:2-C-methyl-D-erythritol 4-phosphate cytidylyltransferase